MGGFLLRRIGQGFLVVVGVTLIVFIATRMVGDPVQVMLPLSASDAQRAAFAHQVGLDRPIGTQFDVYILENTTFHYNNIIHNIFV